MNNHGFITSIGTQRKEITLHYEKQTIFSPRLHPTIKQAIIATPNLYPNS